MPDPFLPTKHDVKKSPPFPSDCCNTSSTYLIESNTYNCCICKRNYHIKCPHCLQHLDESKIAYANKIDSEGNTDYNKCGLCQVVWRRGIIPFIKEFV
jgi:hypothetical protein